MIENGKKVKIHYTLTVEGEVIDSSEQRGPLEYEQGSGQIIPGLESKLAEMNAGDHAHVDVSPEDGYGPVIEEAVIDIPRENLPEGELQIGMLLNGKGANGETLRGIIREIFEDRATVDFNHPLAGKELHFDIEIIEVS
ncbi:MAG: peptidylprolyl isomerase [Candidatus Omnitrophica bacterium]|nr:peptidylprolyl isomerase [Candidatus Omnitrophota bacterium]MDD5671271.1 peptidylprolyl isomerase [Candidatus Omnitrophota bacterium]